jgi:NADPH:quinone reductase-like Zn-dependent oxidoreductase
MARQAGLRFIATAGARNVEAVHGLGAQEVIDYRAVRFEDAVSGIDAVIDLVGGEVQARSFAVLRPGGILVSAVSKPGQEAARRHGVRALFFLVNVTTAHLTQIAAMVDAGDLAVNVGTVLPLADARVAHEMLEGSRQGPRQDRPERRRMSGESTQGEGRREIQDRRIQCSFMKPAMPPLFLRRELCWSDRSAGRPTMT